MEGAAGNGRGVLPMIAALFVRRDSVYKSMPGVEAFDMDRDARLYSGPWPVVAHPPCRAWGQLSHMAKPRPDEKELAVFAVEAVRAFGGVLEHPKLSKLWPACGLPEPGDFDEFGGWTLPVDQNWWGHRARKSTRLYIVGVEPCDIPVMPMVLGEATHVIGSSKKGKPETTKAEREHSPPEFARWLVALAARCAK